MLLNPTTKSPDIVFRLPSSSTLKGANGKNKPQSLVDKLTSRSWVNTAEVDGGVHHKRVQRFVDSLK
jgi:hypothetical protein